MTNPLLSLNKNYPTSAGYAELSQYSIFRDKNLHEEFKTSSWFELNLYGITGKRFSEKELKILNYIWISTSYSDVRIWPNRITALAGSSRATPLISLIGGLASCEAKLFVAQPLVSCLCFFLEISKKIKLGNNLETLLKERIEHNKTIFGYGRPITSVDERVPHFIKFLNELDADKGENFKLAFKIERFLKQEKNIQMNIAALYSAVCADLGFSQIEMNLFVSLLVVAGMAPLYLEALQKPELGVLPLTIDDIEYTGEPNKAWND